jgi:hypothetical protein
LGERKQSAIGFTEIRVKGMVMMTKGNPGWHYESHRHSLAAKGIKTTAKSPKTKMTKVRTATKQPYIQIDDTFYHRTWPNPAKAILREGFYVEPGGNQRFGVGVYMLNHPEGDYGNTTLRIRVQGKFIDLTDDEHGDEWIEMKKNYYWKSYEQLTNQIKRDYPQADGIAFNGMLVVWNTKTIKEIGYA